MSVNSEILTILVLILINGVLAMSEAAMLATRKVKLQQLSNEGDKAAQAALELLKNPNVFLSTIQIVITMIGVFAGAVGGATIANAFAIQLERIEWLAPYAESLAFGVVVVVITILTIWLGELVPKRIGLHSPERITKLVAGPMVFLSTLFSPLVKLMSWGTELILTLFGIKHSAEPPITEEELQVLIDQGTQAGVFEVAEQDMVEGVFSLGDQRVYSLMTPRTEIVWLDVEDNSDEILEKIGNSPYSRFPLRQDSLETIIGIVKSRDLLVMTLAKKEINLRELAKAPTFIPETMLASRALEVLKKNNTEMLLVVDEFGGVQGLLTINDILEEIVGVMQDEEPQATQRQDGSWLLDGMLEVDEFKDIFDLNELPHEDEYETLSGFVMTSLGRIPQAADHFEWNNLRFEVVDMDGRRVDKVLVTAKQKPGTD